MNCIPHNEFSVKTHFVLQKNKKVERDRSLVMGSLDVDLLFTNIFLDETIDICTITIYSQQVVIELLTNTDFKHGILFYFQQSFIWAKGVAMSSPLAPTLANSVFCFHEKNGLKECLLESKLVFYRIYVGDIFVWFKSTEHLQKFCNYFNTFHPNISFSFEKEITVKCS